MQQPSILLVEDDAFQRKAAETYLVNHDLTRHCRRERRPDAPPDLPRHARSGAARRPASRPGGRLRARPLAAREQHEGRHHHADRRRRCRSTRCWAWKAAPTTMSPSPTSRASCWPAARACCGARSTSPRRRGSNGSAWATHARPRPAPAARRRRPGRGPHLGRVRHPEDLRREPQPAAVSRDWLLETTSHRSRDPFDRAIDLRITRIRRKIEPTPGKAHRHSHRARRRLYVRAARRIG